MIQLCQSGVTSVVGHSSQRAKRPVCNGTYLQPETLTGAEHDKTTFDFENTSETQLTLSSTSTAHPILFLPPSATEQQEKQRQQQFTLQHAHHQISFLFSLIATAAAAAGASVSKLFLIPRAAAQDVLPFFACTLESYCNDDDRATTRSTIRKIYNTNHSHSGAKAFSPTLITVIQYDPTHWRNQTIYATNDIIIFHLELEPRLRALEPS